MTDQQIKNALTRFIKAHEGHKQASAVLGISQGYLSDILSGRRAVPDSILAHLNLERIVTYKRIKSANSR
jgi:hypothetical protein